MKDENGLKTEILSLDDVKKERSELKSHAFAIIYSNGPNPLKKPILDRLQELTELLRPKAKS